MYPQNSIKNFIFIKSPRTLFPLLLSIVRARARPGSLSVGKDHAQ
jgi:hypothetical protein